MVSRKKDSRRNRKKSRNKKGLSNPELLKLSREMFKGEIKYSQIANLLNEAAKLKKKGEISEEEYVKAVNLFHKAKERKES